MPTDSTVERAFELARSGVCQSVSDIRRQLKAEGYSNITGHFDSGALKKQLTALINAR